LKEKLKELEDERIRREELEEVKDLQEKEILKFQEIISSLSEQLENANEVAAELSSKQKKMKKKSRKKIVEKSTSGFFVRSTFD